MRTPTFPAWLLLTCSLVSSALGCSPSSPPSSKAADSAEPEEELPRPPRKERRLDPRITVDNLRARLTPYIESIGAGFGAGYQPTGIVSVSAAGENVYEHAFGRADQQAGTPNTADTSFRIGGISSQFTATAVLRLAQAGKLALTDSIKKYLPEYPEPGAAITVHQLLSHTGGLPNYLLDPALVPRRAQAFTPKELLELFWNEPLEFTPGSDFRYSDSGYAVLGVIIERVSGQSYEAFMQREIFSRFGLEHTRVGDGPADEQSARGYSASESGGLEAVQGFHSSILYAGGGIRSTARDLLLWHDALQNGEVLDAEHQAALSKPVSNHYAYGWFVREELGHTVLSHAGGVEGFVSHFARIPDLDLAAVVLFNNSSIDTAQVLLSSLGAALGEKVEPRSKDTLVALEPDIPPRITGTYRLSDSAAEEMKQRKVPKKALAAMRSVRIIEEQGKLLFKPIGQAAVPMIATGRSSFVLVGGKAKIEVELDSNGSPATRLVLKQGPLSIEFTRRARVRGKPEEPENTDALP